MAITSCHGAFGSQAVTLNAHTESAIRLLPENFELLLDQSVNQTPDDVAARWSAGEFSPATDLNLGLQRSGAWARIELNNTMDQPGNTGPTVAGTKDAGAIYRRRRGTSALAPRPSCYNCPRSPLRPFICSYKRGRT